MGTTARQLHPERLRRTKGHVHPWLGCLLCTQETRGKRSRAPPRARHRTAERLEAECVTYHLDNIAMVIRRPHLRLVMAVSPLLSRWHAQMAESPSACEHIAPGEPSMWHKMCTPFHSRWCCQSMVSSLGQKHRQDGPVSEQDATVGGDRRSSVKMRLVNRLEQWTLYPMTFLWVAAFIVGFYDAYRYMVNNL